MFWNNLSLNKKTFAIIGAFLLIIAAMATFTATRIDVLSAESGQMQEATELKGVMLAREIDHLQWVFAVQAFVLDVEQATLSIQEDPTKCGLGLWYYGEEKKRAESVFPGAADMLQKMEAGHNALHASAGKIRELRAEGNVAEARKVFDSMTMPALTEVQTCMHDIAGVMDKASARSADRFRNTVSLSYVALYVSIGLALSLAAVMGLALSRSITRPVILLAGYADKVAGGAYDTQLPLTKRGDELGKLAAALESMVSNIVEALHKAEEQTQEATRALESARVAREEAESARLAAEGARSEGMQAAAVRLEDVTRVITSASSDLSARVEQSEQGAAQQAGNLTETATAMEEMTSTVLEIARNALIASEVASSTREKAQDGERIVQQAVSSITGVQQASEALKNDMSVLAEQAVAISDIMRVISDIADQTNLLALNAAIEAARAGEAGRGFAVVADEVRKLAEKTMISTGNVGSAIESIQKSVTQSLAQADTSVGLIGRATEQAGLSGAALAEIVALVEQSADQIQAIATASEEQSATTEEINRSIGDVNAISTQTAQAMHEAARAVLELAKQSATLGDLINEMKQA